MPSAKPNHLIFSVYLFYPENSEKFFNQHFLTLDKVLISEIMIKLFQFSVTMSVILIKVVFRNLFSPYIS